jgi:two-component system chemotaxis response regulator CheB
MVFPPNHDRSPQPLNCIVVDDSLIFRKVVRDCLKQMPNITVIDIAADGLKAIDKITEHRPDLVTLDVEMPGKDGLEVLKAIRERGIDCDVIMVSGQTDRGADVTTKALSLGAFDFILKPNANDPESNMRELLAALVPKIDAIRKRRRRRIESSTSTSPVDKTAIGPSWAVRRDNPSLSVSGNETASSKVTPKPRPRCNTADVIVIGVSTGGPSALREILPKLPANFPLPVLIVQHMPPLFTASLARDLNEFCAVTVCEAQHRQLIRPGTVYIAPGGAQMRVAGLAGCRHIEITDDPPIRACKPSVDYLFSSVADTYGGNCLAIILTGMGNDGTAGSRQLHACGARIVAQDEASCTVFGMPRQVIDAGLADRIETLHQIPSLMSRIAGQGAMVCL